MRQTIILLISVFIIYLIFQFGFGKSENSLDSKPVDQFSINQTENMSENMQAVIKTNKGNIVLELANDKAPKTVENFIKLAQSGFYNEVKFHRIIKGFMIQSGDPLTKDDSQMAYWGTGGPDYRFEDEFNSDLSNITGTISMANSGPNTNGSQFFINVADNTYLDNRHSVFGKVIEGMDVVTAISEVETGERDIPVEPVVIQSIEIK